MSRRLWFLEESPSPQATLSFSSLTLEGNKKIGSDFSSYRSFLSLCCLTIVSNSSVNLFTFHIHSNSTDDSLQLLLSRINFSCRRIRSQKEVVSTSPTGDEVFSSTDDDDDAIEAKLLPPPFFPSLSLSLLKDLFLDLRVFCCCTHWLIPVAHSLLLFSSPSSSSSTSSLSRQKRDQGKKGTKDRK